MTTATPTLTVTIPAGARVQQLRHGRADRLGNLHGADAIRIWRAE
jgi:hypothetical protein